MFSQLESAWNAIVEQLGGGVLQILGALLILVIGWIVARMIAGGVRRLLKVTDLDNRIATAMGGATIKVEDILARIVFYALMLLVLVLVLQRFDLGVAAEPLNGMLGTMFEFVPKLISAGLIALVAYILATIVRTLVKRGADAFKLDERLTQSGALQEGEQIRISDTIASVAFGLIVLLFLPAILDALGMQGMLEPVQSMFNNVLGFLPQIFAAAVIYIVGFFIARIVRQLVTGVASAAGADRLGERMGLSNVSLSRLLGTVVYALILIPVIIQALQALQIEAISGPATSMLETIMAAIPGIFGAAVVLGISYFVARLVANLVTDLLTGIGTNRLPEMLDIEMRGDRTLSQLVGYVVLVLIMLFATMEAAALLGFGSLSDIISVFIAFSGNVLLGIVILTIGLYFANWVRTLILSAGQTAFVANLARWAILVLAGAMSLRQMGLADDIVNLAFGIILGAMGIAAALAFGLGSTKIAGREVENFLTSMRSTSTD